MLASRYLLSLIVLIKIQLQMLMIIGAFGSAVNVMLNLHASEHGLEQLVDFGVR